jgi:hypothetical protein
MKTPKNHSTSMLLGLDIGSAMTLGLLPHPPATWLNSSAGFCLDPVQSDQLAIELLQAVSAASNLGIIQHALLAGSDSQIAAMADIVDSLPSQAPSHAPPPPCRPRNTQAPPGPAPRGANALSDPAGVRRPG